MILFKFKEIPETRTDYPCSAFRWVIEAGNWSFGIAHQHKDKYTEEWHSSHSDFFGVAITKYFGIGISHTWYNGPHCSFTLGWFQILWGGNPFTGRCRKCEG